MVALPSAAPHTIPVPEPTVAIEGLLLDQLPTGTALVKVTQLPLHNDGVPEMAEGAALTVIIFVAEQPLL